MKSKFGAYFSVLSLGASCFFFAACGDDDDDDHHHVTATAGAAGEPSTSDGSAECAVIGELCHEADSGSGAAHDCHEVGHVADGAACLSSFDGCVKTCVDDGDGDADADADPRCAALGELCHPVDDHDGPLHACHELGHENDAEGCAAAFDDCAAQCLAAREALEEATPPSGGAGAGGAGGAENAAATGGVAGGH
ncbi:MAG TPA: hypothetical protein VEQ58_08665 [Polyangiaceae bacterium]|nr:hypothetical protein [Polyangiaceae bacterium]